MKVLLYIIPLAICVTSFGQAENAIRRRNFNHESGVAMRDFDPVSYFKGKPMKGDSKFSIAYQGITYYFVNQANKDEFKKAPAKYEPAYGGWCAYAMGLNGTQVKVDPTTYKIVGGKLYLFSNFNGKNMLLKWNENEKKLKVTADKNWDKKMH